MPRQPATSGPTQPHLDEARPEVQQIAERLRKTPPGLRDYFEVGEQMQRLADDPSLRRRGGRWRQRLAEMLGCSLSTLNKSLHFWRSYEEGELKALEDLGVGWSRMTVAVVVADSKERLRLLEKAKDEGWSDRDLHRAIQGTRGIRKKGGRPRREAKSQGVVGDLTELLRLTRPWLDFHEQVWAPGVEGYLESLAKLPPGVHESFGELARQAAPQLQELAKHAREVQAWLKSLGGPAADENR